MKKNHLIFFSGGLASFSVAYHVQKNFPNDNILLYFTDTKWEDEDLYRFIDEVSDKLKLPLLKHSMGVDPVELMIKRKIIFNSRIGDCSVILKMKTAANFIKKGIVPQLEEWRNKEYLGEFDFNNIDTVYFGIGYDEFHRVGAIKENWQPFNVQFPLVETMYNYDDLLSLYDIRKPNMYVMGFVHNNCKGRCVKAGKGHFRLLYKEDRKTFDEINHIEQTLGEYVAAWHFNKNDETKLEDLKNNTEEMYKWHNSKYQYQPKLLHLAPKDVKRPSIMKNSYIDDIRKEQENNVQINFLEELGGCGCFVDYEEEKIYDQLIKDIDLKFNL